MEDHRRFGGVLSLGGFIKVVGERISNSVARVCVKVTSLAVFLVQLDDVCIHPGHLLSTVLQRLRLRICCDVECLFIHGHPFSCAHCNTSRNLHERRIRVSSTQGRP